jgi:hypothetical protein
MSILDARGAGTSACGFVCNFSILGYVFGVDPSTLHAEIRFAIVTKMVRDTLQQGFVK